MALPRIRFLFVLVLMISVVCHPVLRKRILVKAFSSITTRSLPRGLIQRSSLVSAANPQWTDRRRFSTLDSGTSEPDVADHYGNDPYGYSPNESDWNDDDNNNNDNLELQSNYWQQVHGLNDAQTKAVTQPLHAVTRVVAGPGSGKTRVLTCRIAYLLNNAPHERILAVTFTRKAAGEMQQRLEALLTANDNKQADGDNVQEGNENQSYHPDLNRVTLGTFHSVCGKILRWNGDFLATLPSVQQTMLYSPDPVHLDGSFGIIDQSEQLRILKECLEQGNIDLKKYKDIRPFNVLSAIGKAKSMYAQGENPFALDGKKQLPTLREIASKVYPRYVQKLLSTNCLDFDDLILMARELLDTQPEVRERLQRRWNHVLIDEFQDTSKTQMDLVKLLTSHSLFVVGDADQSIYSWRGAHVGSLQDLEEDFGNVNTVFLMENYRSTSNIVKAAQKIISSSEGGLRQDMKPKRGSGPAPRVVACADDREEAQFVIQSIKENLDAGKYTDQHEVALIYRTNAQSRVLEEACVNYNLPYVQFGSATSFYKRQEIKDVLCYLRWLYNGMDRGSMLRTFKTPSKGLGEKAILEFDEYCNLVAEHAGRSQPGTIRPNPLAVLLSLSDETESVWGPDAPLPSDSISSRPLKLFKEFSQQMKKIYVKAHEVPLEILINEVLNEFDLFTHLDKISKTNTEFEERKANVRELQNAAQRYTAKGPSMTRKPNGASTSQPGPQDSEDLESPLGNYLDDVSLITDMADQGRNSEDKRFKVCLMTIHASKGMEFDTVYVVGNEDGTFPSSQSIMEGEGSVQLEEEKRLCYVAMTRAKTELILTWRKEVPVFTSAGIRTVSKKRSRFLNVLTSKKGRKKANEPQGSAAPKKKSSKQSLDGTNAVFSKRRTLQQPDRERKSNSRSLSTTSRPQQAAKSEPYPPRPRYSSGQPSNLPQRNRRQRNGTQGVYSRRSPGIPAAYQPPSSTPPSPSPSTQRPSSSPPPSNGKKKEENISTDKQNMDSTWFFPVGSKVTHAKFGQGVVLPPPPPRKEGDMPVAVQFPNGERREFSAHGNDLSPILF